MSPLANGHTEYPIHNLRYTSVFAINYHRFSEFFEDTAAALALTSHQRKSNKHPIIYDLIAGDHWWSIYGY